MAIFGCVTDMTMHTKVGGVWQTVTAPAVRVAGVWQAVTSGYVKVAGTWQQFFTLSSALAWGSTPADVSGIRAGAGSVTSGASAGAATGGTAPYSYAWTFVSGVSFTINSPFAASSTFTTSIPADVLVQGVYRLTATDAVAATISFDITVTLESTP